MITLGCRTETPVPIPMGYKEIAADLRARIEAGEYERGKPLPSYRELAALYSVGVTTMQRAVRELMHAGLITGRQGRALYVTEDPAEES